jgi:cysteine-rich repeat protein
MMNASPAARVRTSVLLALALLISYVPLPTAYSIGHKSSPAGLAKAFIAPGAKLGTAKLAAAKQKARESYGKMPVYFEANRGQFDQEVKFVSRGSGPKTFLTPTEAVFVLHKPETAQPQLKASGKNVSGAIKAAAKTSVEARAQYKIEQAARAAERAASKSVVRMSLAGANASANLVGLEELPGKINYFRGNNPDNWVKDVPIFNRVQYTQAYPGIDLVYYGKGSQLEYDFVVAPGADPSRIGFNFAGAERVEVDAVSGELIIHAAGGAQLRQGKPVIYQEAQGSKHAVTGGFAINGSEVKFAVGNYDAALPLIIDPVVFTYSTYLSGELDDRAHDIAVDADGNAYIAGWTDSDSFPTKNAYQPGNNNSGQEAFITKLDPSGSALVWSTYLGGGFSTFSEGAYGITIDADRNVYVTGFTDSGDFPTRNPMQPHLADTLGGNDSFITKLNAAGNQLVFSTYFGGSSGGSGCGACGVGNDIGRDIALDSNNNVYVVGYTDSPTFPTTNAIQEEIDGNPTQPEGGNYFDAYLAKIDASGQFRIYSTYLGGANDDVGLGVAVDADGNAYVTGWTESTAGEPFFPTTEGAFREVPGGTGYSRDAFVTKVNSTGSAFEYSTFLGGEEDDVAWGIALGIDGSAHVTGYTNSSSIQGYPTTTNAYQQSNNGGYDAFLTRLKPDGSGLIYSTFFGGNDDEGSGPGMQCLGCGDRYDGAAIAVDVAGNAYITGFTESTFVAPTSEDPPNESAVCSNGVVETPNEQCDDSNLESGDGCSDTCQLEFINFPTKDAAQPQPGSDAGATDEAARDAYVAKFNTTESGEASLIYSTFLGGSRQDEGQGIAVDLATNAYVVGWTATDGEDCECDNLIGGKASNLQASSNDFPTTSGAFQEEPIAWDDAFVTKIGGGGTFAGESESDFSIVGRVTRPDGVTVVPGVTITLTRPDDTTSTDTTDDNGFYAFDDLAPGDYTVTPSGGSSTDLYSPPNQDVTITNENERADFTATQTFSISGRVTTNGTTGLDGVTITVTRAADGTPTGTTTTAADGTYTVSGLLNDDYIVTPSRAFYTFTPPNRAVTVDSNEVGVDFLATSAPGTVGFTASSAAESSRNEDAKSFQITVTRVGDTSGAADLDYATFDGPPPGPPRPPAASERADYITSLGRLHFGANEATKTITIFIVDDALVEGSEALTLVLSNPTNNLALSPPASLTLTIVDNDSNPSAPNPIDQSAFFVRQHYLDFLNREPDAAGLAFWVNNIESCGSDLQCRQTKRIDTSAAFFLSIEFQETGFVVVRAYRAAFDRQVGFREFLRDTQEIQRGIIVGQGSWQLQLEQHRQAFLRQLVRTSEFLTRYPESQTRDQYLDALFASADFTPTAAERLQVSNAYDSGAPDQTESRANALRALIQLERFRQREFSPAFVLMQYIGYLRRDPDDLGYNFWLNKLNLNHGDYGAAEMVAAFITSIEYRQRFGL